MAKIYGEAVQTSGETSPWAAVMYYNENEINRVAADSKEEAEQLVVKFLAELSDNAKDRKA